jgi:hypothetical protein
MRIVRAVAPLASLLAVAAATLFSACASSGARPPSPPGDAGRQKPGAMSLERGSKSGSQLWEESCGRCHNFRSPTSYGAAGWDVAMAHMRLRANLTAEEEKAIVEFLKSANEGGQKKNKPQ